MEGQNNSLEVFLPLEVPLETSLEVILARRYHRRSKSGIKESYRKAVKMYFYGLNSPECMEVYEVSMLVVEATV